MNQLLLWWRHGEITYFWISKTSRPIIRTQMTFEISLTFILPSQNWITDICNCHLRCVTSWMSFSVSSLQISVIQFRLVKTELQISLSFRLVTITLQISCIKIPTIQNVITTSQKEVVDIYNVNSGLSNLVNKWQFGLPYRADKATLYANIVKAIHTEEQRS